MERSCSLHHPPVLLHKKKYRVKILTDFCHLMVLVCALTFNSPLTGGLGSLWFKDERWFDKRETLLRKSGTQMEIMLCVSVYFNYYHNWERKGFFQ